MLDFEAGYCKKCIMKKGNPGLTLDHEGVCSLCNPTNTISAVDNGMDEVRKNLDEYYQYIRSPREVRHYDCLVMLSGGKDSIYMLYKLLNEGVRPLVFTLNHPFESKFALKNIEKVSEKLEFDHLNYTLLVGLYKKLMKIAFLRRQEEVAPETVMNEKTPCSICTSVIRITAFITAAKMGIPFIVYSADQQQIPPNAKWQIKNIITSFNNFCGVNYHQKIFGLQLDEYLTLPDHEIPRFVFPYLDHTDYNANRIIAELKDLGLYESSPWETHCSLHSLLNYYAIRRYDMFIYTTFIRTQVVAGTISREALIRFIEDYKKLYLEVITKEELDAAEKEHLLEFLKFLHPQGGSTLEFEYQDLLSLRKTAKILDLDLSEI